MRSAGLAAVVAFFLLAAPVLAGPSDSDSPAVDLNDTVSRAEIMATPFDKYLKYKTYRVEMKSGAVYEGGFVHGPGHHSSAIAALVFDPNGVPYATFKTGDTRLSRAVRGQPYVATSGIAGRWDKEGHSTGEIVLEELAEEVGGQVVEGTFRRLGDELSPTMPFESTECDEYFMAAVNITGTPYGDGGSMEVVGLIGPVFFNPQAAIAAMDLGRISDSGRARTMFGRAWDAIGYLPALGVYVQDHPGLLARFDTLGLGEPKDLRERVKGAPVPKPDQPGSSLNGRVNSVAVVGAVNVPLGHAGTMVDARIRHVVDPDPFFVSGLSLEGAYLQAGPNGDWACGGKEGSLAMEPDFASQFLRTENDRVKTAVFYQDETLGPMIQMSAQVRPAMAFAPGSPRVIRRDISDEPVERPGSWKSRAEQSRRTGLATIGAGHGGLAAMQFADSYSLGVENAASSGQSELFYWYRARSVEPATVKDATFVPLAEAIRLCRQGHGDAQTEATLLRLADDLDWIPELGMSRTDALTLCGR